MGKYQAITLLLNVIHRETRNALHGLFFDQQYINMGEGFQKTFHSDRFATGLNFLISIADNILEIAICKFIIT